MVGIFVIVEMGCVETYISGPALEKNWSQLSNLNQSLPEINSKFR